MDGKKYRIVEFQHVNPGNWRAFVRTKLKDMQTGNLLEKTFRDRDQVKEINLSTRDMELLYSDQDGYHFMDQENYDQVTLSKDDLGDAILYIKDHDVIKVDMYEQKAIGVTLPPSATLKIVYTEPAIKGDTAQGATKTARLETGLEIKVPLFIKEGEVVKLDTRTGEFLGRA